MEISNNLVPTLSQADSPSQPSEGNPLAKNAKKKVPGEESSFDGALATTLASARPDSPTKDLGKLAGEVRALQGSEIADRVDLSKEAKAESAKAASAKAEGGAPAPTIASLFQAKAEDSAKGQMASAFVAGPDQPWGSRWVFAGGNQPAPEEIEAMRTSGGKPAPLAGAPSIAELRKLVEAASAEGGDGSQLKQATESTLKSIDSAIAELGGRIDGVRTNQADAEEAPAKSAPSVLGGAEFVSALQSAKAGGSGTNGGSLNGRSQGRSPAALAGVDGLGAEATKSLDGFGVASEGAKSLGGRAKPDLQVLPGGKPTGDSVGSGRLEGGLRLAKEEPKLHVDTFYPNGIPLTAASRQDGHLGAVPPQTITGHVVPGSMMRDRLTSESLRNIAGGISNMRGAGGGEMRIRLNPGNLGELMIRVSTNGKDVGLKVQANDPAAKKVIEESLGALRDSLASQSLALGRVDVTVATNASQGSDLGQNSQQQSSNHSAFAGFDGQSANQNRSMDGFFGGEERSSRTAETGVERPVARASRIAAMGGGSASRATDSSRLDVMA